MENGEVEVQQQHQQHWIFQLQRLLNLFKKLATRCSVCGLERLRRVLEKLLQRAPFLSNIGVKVIEAWKNIAVRVNSVLVLLLVAVFCMSGLVIVDWFEVQNAVIAFILGVSVFFVCHCVHQWRYRRQLRKMLSLCAVCADYNRTLTRILKGDLLMAGFECEGVTLSQDNPWSCCDCAKRDLSQDLFLHLLSWMSWLHVRQPQRQSITREKTALVVWSKLSVDTTHVVEEDNSDFIWIRLPEKLVHSMQDPLITQLFVQSQPGKVWMFLSGDRFEQHITRTLSGNDEQWVKNSVCNTEICVDGPQGLRHYRIFLSFALKYNGWPPSAKSWILKASDNLHADLVPKIIQAGCWAVYQECSKEECPDHSLDWRYDFSEVDSLLFQHYSEQTALCLAYLNLLKKGKDTQGGLQWNTALLDCLRIMFFKLAKYSEQGVLDFRSTEKILTAEQQLLGQLETGIRKENLTHHVLNSVNVLEQMSPGELRWMLVLLEKVKRCR